MNEKMKSAFSGRKAKVAGITLCAALILSVGTLTALASANEGFLTFPFLQPGERISNLSVRSDGEGASFSTDGGVTWSDTVPEGVAYTEVTTEDGGSFHVSVTVVADDSDSGLFEDYHVTRPAFPFGFDDFPQGVFEYRTSLEGFEYSHMLRVENDNVYHSLDNGETWIEGFPEAMAREGADEYSLYYESEDGSVSFRHSVAVNTDE